MSRDEKLAQIKTQLLALSIALPELTNRLRMECADHPSAFFLPTTANEYQRLAAFAAYIDHYSRVDERTIETINVQQVLSDAATLVRTEIERNGIFRTNFLASPVVRANPHQLGHVFVSLLINAAQALRATDHDNRVEVELDTNDAGWARIAITDTGAGIDASVLPFIFNPLYSTKRGAGMGIGLAIAQQVINEIGGRISVESSPGLGSLFIVEIPPSP